MIQNEREKSVSENAKRHQTEVDADARPMSRDLYEPSSINEPNKKIKSGTTQDKQSDDESPVDSRNSARFMLPKTHDMLSSIPPVPARVFAVDAMSLDTTVLMSNVSSDSRHHHRPRPNPNPPNQPPDDFSDQSTSTTSIFRPSKASLHSPNQPRRKSKRLIEKAQRQARQRQEDEEKAMSISEPIRDRSESKSDGTANDSSRDFEFNVSDFELLREAADNNRFVFQFDDRKLQLSQRHDPFLNIIVRYLKGEDDFDEVNDLYPKLKSDVKKNLYYLDDRRLLRFKHSSGRNLIVLPVQHRKLFMKYYHTNLETGMHSGATAVEHKLLRRYYWPGFQSDIRHYVASCKDCQLMRQGKPKRGRKMKLFQPHDIPGGDLSVDCSGPFPVTPSGKEYVVSFQCRFTSKVFPHAVERIDAETIAMLLNQHCMVHGTPNTLLSDQGTEFLNDLLDKLYQIMGIKKINTSSGYPQTDGQNERWHRDMNAGLKCISSQLGLNFNDRKQARWDVFLPNIAAAHNRRWSRRLGMRPDSVYFGHHVRTNLEQGFEDTACSEPNNKNRRKANEWVHDQGRLISALAKVNLKLYDQSRKDYFDRLINERIFKIGDRVKYYTKSLGDRPKFGKLEGKWIGPVTITELFNDDYNVILSNGVSTNVHKVLPWRDRNNFDWEIEASDTRDEVHRDNADNRQSNHDHAHFAKDREIAQLKHQLQQLKSQLKRANESHEQSRYSHQRADHQRRQRGAQRDHQDHRHRREQFAKMPRSRSMAERDQALSSSARRAPVLANRSRQERKLGAVQRHVRSNSKQNLKFGNPNHGNSSKEADRSPASPPTSMELDSGVSHGQPAITHGDLEFEEALKGHAMSLDSQNSMNVQAESKQY